MGEVGVTDGEIMAIREKLVSLESALRDEINKGHIQEVDCDEGLDHQFAPGVYMRTLNIKQGTLIIGKIHKHEHPNILSKGEVLVLTESGGVEHLTGPVQMISPAGTKRAVYALQDTVWTTIHLTDETDLKKIEDKVIAPSFDAYQNFLLENSMNKDQLKVSP